MPERQGSPDQPRSKQHQGQHERRLRIVAKVRQVARVQGRQRQNHRDRCCYPQAHALPEDREQQHDCRREEQTVQRRDRRPRHAPLQPPGPANRGDQISIRALHRRQWCAMPSTQTAASNRSHRSAPSRTHPARKCFADWHNRDRTQSSPPDRTPPGRSAACRRRRPPGHVPRSRAQRRDEQRGTGNAVSARHAPRGLSIFASAGRARSRRTTSRKCRESTARSTAIACPWPRPARA